MLEKISSRLLSQLQHAINLARSLTMEIKATRYWKKSKASKASHAAFGRLNFKTQRCIQKPVKRLRWNFVHK